jgi:hypothetical protein
MVIFMGMLDVPPAKVTQGAFDITWAEEKNITDGWGEVHSGQLHNF